MQRLFSNFADGWPGGGILLLRLVAGAGLILRGMSAVRPGAPVSWILLQIAAALAGLLLIGGLWTPMAGVLVAIIEASIALRDTAPEALAIILATLGVSLAMIGPGAWSIDARLYGRKQILPPE